MDITGSLYPGSGSNTSDVGYLWYDTSDNTIHSLSLPGLDDKKIQTMWERYFNPKHRLRVD